MGAAYEELKIVHRDIKLENVVLHERPININKDDEKNSSHGGNGSGNIANKERMFDLGVAKIIDFDTCEQWWEGKEPTEDVMGTDQYISPEAYEGLYCPASDVFAAGVLFFKLATGKFPFSSEIFNDEPGENYIKHPKMQEIRLSLKM